MTLVRLSISAFILVVVALLVQGWLWTATHQPPPQATASHVVLAGGILGSIVGLAVLWRRR